MTISAKTSPWCAVGSADKNHRRIIEGRMKKPRRGVGRADDIPGDGAAPAGLRLLGTAYHYFL